MFIVLFLLEFETPDLIGLTYTLLVILNLSSSTHVFYPYFPGSFFSFSWPEFHQIDDHINIYINMDKIK